MIAVINIIKNVIRILSNSKAADQSSTALNKLRSANPSCTIISAGLCDVSMGKSVAIHNAVYLNQVHIGNYSYVSNDSRLVNVSIGNFCSIGPYVQIGLAPHPSQIFVSTYPAFYTDQNGGCLQSFREDKIFDDSVEKTTIDNDVWIGSNAIIPGGIHIGTGAIVAAGAVVVKDIPPYAIVGGNPAKIIRYRFTEEQIKALLDSEWWNWPIEKIRQNADNFSDIEKFRVIIN
jgi:acetyltransferase-like isoleucine patch superfamily enzyme